MTDGKYYIDTVVSSVEIMKIFDKTLCEVFAGSEVLCLYNIHSEGLSLTKLEWDFLIAELQYFPSNLTKFLLSVNMNTEPEHIPLIKQALEDLLDWLLYVHPLSGVLRICNKLLSLLQNSHPYVHKRVKSQASRLQKNIEQAVVTTYTRLLSQAPPLDVMLAKILSYQPSEIKVDQGKIIGVPSWYKLDDQLVEESIVVQLLIANADLQSLQKLTSVSSSGNKNNASRVSQAQEQTIAHLKHIFYAEYILVMHYYYNSVFYYHLYIKY